MTPAASALRGDPHAGPLTAAPTGAPSRAIWITAALVSLAVHVGVAVWMLRPEPALEFDEDLIAIPIELGPAEAPPAGRIEDLEPPPPPPPEPEPEPEIEPAPEPEVPTERAEDAPDPVQETPPPPPRPAPPEDPPRLTSSAGGEATEGFGFDGSLSLEEFQMVARYIDTAAAPFIAELRYPRAALRRELEGTGMILVRVNRSGRIVESRIYTSSGEPILDAELRRVIRAVRRLDPLPPGFPREELVFLVPVRFELFRG